jgi:hypothetical protein
MKLRLVLFFFPSFGPGVCGWVRDRAHCLPAVCIDLVAILGNWVWMEYLRVHSHHRVAVSPGLYPICCR